jgi:hypothetical protein
MRFVVLTLVFSFAAMGAAARAAEPNDVTASYRAACPGDAIYASCADQQKILQAGLRQAKAGHKRAIVIVGFNTCGPCNALATWLEMPERQIVMGSYTLIELSIFDPQHEIRSEVFDAILPPLKLSINRTSPYGVPLFAIVDPASNRVVGQPVLGYNPDAIAAYMAASRGQ